MKLMNKRIISLLLVLVMLFGMVPMTAFATEKDPGRLSLGGLNVLCLGDSITAGQGLTTDTRWTNVLASKYDWNLTNKSQGGISLTSYYYTTNGKSDVSIAKKAEVLKTMTTKPDVIIVWGGHNDTSYRASPLGTWDDETTDSFKGALKYIAELADEYAPDATLFVLTPLWNNENPSTLKVPENTTDTNWMFVDAIYEGADIYGWIPINMDLCGITPFTKSGLLLDNIHPNEAGTEKIVEYLSEELASYGQRSKKETIIFNKSAVSMEAGENTTLKGVLSPRSGTGITDFTWSSSRPSVATVDTNGKITAVAHGNAIITATTSDGTSATVSVTVDRDDHTYKNGICTGCGEEHTNLANYKGKVISILGDSISTFAGYIPTADGFNLEHLSRYPDADRIPDVTEAEQTWWMQVITELDAKLGINDSWRGAMVSGAAAVTTGSTGPNAALSNLQRIRNLGANGTPDVILFYGGTNDYAHLSAIGTFDPTTAPVEADLTTASWNNLADAYVQTLLRLRYYYPDAVIVAMLPTYTASYYSDTKLSQGNAVLAEICAHYGIPCLDLRSSGVTAAHLPDGIHPGAEGMGLIADAVVDLLLSQCNPEIGENVVYSVTHGLSGASASLGYFKGVTHGSVFSESLTGDDLDVTVTMGGKDITALCYADGKITISSVTGDLLITAKGKFNADGHLQMLPEEMCCGTNLWSVLEHDNQYYTVDGWGIHNSGRVYSVTFPVSENDRIYATSFGAGSVNGSGSTNGIRVTYFFEDGSIRSLSTDTVYSEFSANGYLTMPAGVLAVSVPMWTVSDSNALYIRNREHCYENGVCTACGRAGIIDEIGNTYDTLSAAIAAVEPGSVLILLSDITEDVTVNKDIVLDLNGYDVTGYLTVTNGYTLYGMDSQTDDYTIEDEFGYGKLTNVVLIGNGQVLGLPEESDAADAGYLKITEDGAVSFHCVNLQITAMTLRSEEVGLYFKSEFAGDEKVVAQVKTFGVALSVKGEPNAENLETDCGYSIFENFAAGANNNNATSTLLRGIMSEDMPSLINKRNANLPVYGRAYIELNDGSYLFGAVRARSLQEQVEGADQLWDSLTAEQKAAITAMYETFQTEIKNWNIPNIRENEIA